MWFLPLLLRVEVAELQVAGGRLLVAEDLLLATCNLQPVTVDQPIMRPAADNSWLTDFSAG